MLQSEYMMMCPTAKKKRAIPSCHPDPDEDSSPTVEVPTRVLSDTSSIRPSMSPVLALLNPPKDEFGCISMSSPLMSPSLIGFQSPSVIPLPGREYGYVMSLDELPANSLCPLRRRWSSMLSASSLGNSPAKSDRGAADGCKGSRLEDVQLEELEIVLSPSGVIRHAEIPYALSSTYTFYFDYGKSRSRTAKDANEYAQSLITVGTVATIQEFWQYYNNMNVSSMPMSSDLSIFAKGVTPLWENKENQDGGRWIISGFQREETSTYFQRLAIAFLGQQFVFHEEINGVVLSVRHKGNTVALWNHTVDPRLFEPVDVYLRTLLDDPKVIVEYRDHRGAMAHNSQKRKLLGGKKNKHRAPETPHDEAWQAARAEQSFSESTRTGQQLEANLVLPR